MKQCISCGKFIEEYYNYCTWSCQIDDAKKSGGQAHLPNNLPVGCIRHDGAMLEHEHGDHPDYKFPVTIEYCGSEENTPYWSDGLGNKTDAPELQQETHALIYSDGAVAITMYECCYAMWYLYRNEFGGGSLWKKGEWRLTQDSLLKIRNLHPEKYNG